MIDFIETTKKALDVFARATGIRIVRDPLLHPCGDDVCTLEVPGYRQLESYTCGVVAGAMILHTFHPKRSLDDFFDLCNSDIEMGLDTKPLIRCLRSNGVGVSEKHDLTFERIAATIDKGFPILTLIKTKQRDTEHWVVLYGYGRNPNRVFEAGDGLPLISAVMGQKEVPWSEFSKRVWADRGFGLVCWGK